MKSKIINLPYGITVELFEGGSGAIESDLDVDSTNPAEWAANNTVESLILSLACAGVDVSTPEFAEGVSSCIDALINNVY